MTQRNVDKNRKNFQRVPAYEADYDSIHRKPSPAEIEFLWLEMGFDIHADHFSGCNGIHVEAGWQQQQGEEVYVLNDYWQVSNNMVPQQEE